MRLSICFTIDSVEFTAGVISGDQSLGGSESACVGLARALKARGHNVHIFTTKLGADAPEQDHAGVIWHDMAKLSAWALYMDWDVAIALRQPVYLQHLPAKFRMLWCQDLMANDTMKNFIMSLAWTYDAIAYVSAYHRKQWEGWLPEIIPVGWATKNGHDAALAEQARASAVKKPHQIIHISRPERGLIPLLQMWPALRAANPQAELALCRYSSMYDPQGWGEVCKSFDEDVKRINAEVGGIRYLGELGKPELYKAIAESAVMWYPGVSTFAETSCIAAIEAQACGTPLVASYKGALPETCPEGVYIQGAAEADESYHAQSIAAVLEMLSGCASKSFAYRQKVAAGLKHVKGYSYEALAEEWETFLLAAFQSRYEAQKPQILAKCDYDDDLVTGLVVATELDTPEAKAFGQMVAHVGAGKDHSPEHYAEFALDPMLEIQSGHPRHANVVQHFTGCRSVLDVACGNGSVAVLLALADPNRHVTAVDYAEANIRAAMLAAEQFGVADRITFHCAPVWDMERQQPSDWLNRLAPASFDGVFCGEFLEHVIGAEALAQQLTDLAKHMGRVVFTVPMGPLNSLVTRDAPLARGHVHHFRPADLDAMFGQQDAYTRLVLPWQQTAARGEAVGAWIVSYRNDHRPIGARPLERRILMRPHQRLTAGIITDNTTDLRRCLENVWPVVDEIVLGDCGAKPGDLDAICREFPRKTRVIAVGPVASLPGGFSEARNRVLQAATGDWFLWIDSDEILCGHVDLGKYLDGPVYRGYTIAQNHLYMDGPMGTDLPVRLFRRIPEIQFYGCVHEQPQYRDANGDIEPLLQLSDVQIAHTGYLHESIRRDKAINRNMPLLVRDQQMFPERLLGKLLVLRDHANLALWDKEKHRGALSESAKAHYGQVIALFEAYFSDPAHKFYPLARPFYEQALRAVNGAIELEIAVAGGINGLNGHRAKPERVWARTPEQIRALLVNRIDDMLKGLAPSPDLDVEPLPIYDAVTEQVSA